MLLLRAAKAAAGPRTATTDKGTEVEVEEEAAAPTGSRQPAKGDKRCLRCRGSQATERGQLTQLPRPWP